MNARVAAIAGIGLLLTSGLASAAEPSSAAGDAARGRQLYHAHGCYGCHGFNGETGARDLVATASPLIADLATFTMFLRQRGELAPLLPSTRMPNYPATALDDAGVRDLYAFVRTFRANAPDVKSVPTLKAILDAASRPAR
ncbi:c-type cytochrome [bacterium]|nr:MAG: c-type cytochrome [bacterium]